MEFNVVMNRTRMIPTGTRNVESETTAVLTHIYPLTDYTGL